MGKSIQNKGGKQLMMVILKAGHHNLFRDTILLLLPSTVPGLEYTLNEYLVNKWMNKWMNEKMEYESS